MLYSSLRKFISLALVIPARCLGGAQLRKFRQKDSIISERPSADELVQLQVVALEVATNPIVSTSRGGTIIWVNKAFEELSGYTRDEAFGQNMRLLNSGQHSSSLYKDMWETILSGRRWAVTDIQLTGH
jgi:PAS domain-containing protein